MSQNSCQSGDFCRIRFCTGRFRIVALLAVGSPAHLVLDSRTHFSRSTNPTIALSDHICSARDTVAPMDPYTKVGISRGTPLWHGGAPGIQVGQHIQSHAQLRRRGVAYGSRNVDQDNNVVYISSVREFARAFATRTAAFRGRETLYLVDPLPSSLLTTDEDFPGTVSLSCTRARVVAIEETNATMSETESLAFVGPHMTWTDGRSVYDDEGYMTPAENWPHADPDELRSLGRWLSIKSVSYCRRRLNTGSGPLSVTYFECVSR